MNTLPDSDRPSDNSGAYAFANLWGGPSYSPEVPPLEMLATFLHDVSSLEAHAIGRGWLAHVETSQACQAIVRDPVFFLKSAHLAISADDVLTQLQAWSSLIPLNSIRAGVIVQPSSRYQAWSENGAVDRWTFDPPMVLVLGAPRQSAYSDFLDVPVVVCSPESLWSKDSMLADDEVAITGADGEVYIAHLWLRYTVAVDQLHALVTEVDSKELQRTVTLLQAHREGCPLSPEDGAGLPLDQSDPIDRQLVGEREVLYYRSLFLAANAATERSRLEAKPLGLPQALAIESNRDTESSAILTLSEWRKLTAENSATEPNPLAAASDFQRTTSSEVKLRKSGVRIVFAAHSGYLLATSIGLDGLPTRELHGASFIDHHGNLCGEIRGAQARIIVDSGALPLILVGVDRQPIETEPSP